MADTPEFIPLREKLGDELEAVQNDALEKQKLVEPTDDEKRNGWTAEELTEYLAGRLAGQSLDIDVNSLQRRVARRPTRQNSRYSPHRWRE